MLRRSCRYKLANDGVDTRTIQGYLGHKSIQHTAPTRFKSLFSGLARNLMTRRRPLVRSTA
jgi:type 1 fimbriae regulatory protein FimB/type 1 fimbriae regulatory protein FimE